MRNRPARPTSAGATRSAAMCCSPIRWSRICAPASKVASPRWSSMAIWTRSWKLPWRSVSAWRPMWRANSGLDQRLQAPSGIEEGLGIDRIVALAHFKMQMGASRAPCRSDLGDGGAGVDALTLLAEETGEVGIAGDEAVIMGDFDHFAIA